jgi:flagellar basal body-associated protein FliL
MEPIIQWIIGIVILVAGGMFGFFWRLSQHHHRRIDEFKKENNRSHNDIHKKIEETDNKSQQRHSLIRDKIEQILVMLHKD